MSSPFIVSGCTAAPVTRLNFFDRVQNIFLNDFKINFQPKLNKSKLCLA